MLVNMTIKARLILLVSAIMTVVVFNQAVSYQAGESVTKSSSGVNDIAASVSEQSVASNEIARNVEKIARELQSAVSRFKT